MAVSELEKKRIEELYLMDEEEDWEELDEEDFDWEEEEDWDDWEEDFE